MRNFHLYLTKVNNDEILNKLSSIDENNIEEVMRAIEIHVDYERYVQEIDEHILNVRNRYKNLNVLNENEMQLIFDEKIKRSNTANFKQSTNCDAQFQSNMKKIHDNYDSSVAWCTVITLSTGGLASPCYAYAVVKTTFESAVAIDRHTLCTQKQKQN